MIMVYSNFYSKLTIDLIRVMRYKRLNEIFLQDDDA